MLLATYHGRRLESIISLCSDRMFEHVFLNEYLAFCKLTDTEQYSELHVYIAGLLMYSTLDKLALGYSGGSSCNEDMLHEAIGLQLGIKLLPSLAAVGIIPRYEIFKDALCKVCNENPNFEKTLATVIGTVIL